MDEKKIVASVSKERKKTIQELFSDYEGEYDVEEIDWGEPVGKEKVAIDTEIEIQ